jgi:hypothetical protein
MMAKSLRKALPKKVDFNPEDPEHCEAMLALMDGKLDPRFRFNDHPEYSSPVTLAVALSAKRWWEMKAKEDKEIGHDNKSTGDDPCGGHLASRILVTVNQPLPC